MIDFMTLIIDKPDLIILARNKIYCWVIDLKIPPNKATYFALLISELLTRVLLKQHSTKVRLVFQKELGHYQAHVLIQCSKEVFKEFKTPEILETILYKDDSIHLFLTIPDTSFMPDEEFLQNERERLIQQSSGEMLQEIKQKNAELQQALQDLKTSSDMIQAEKMRALGGMTAGVAHELNNPMMGILNFIQYALKHTEEGDRRYQPLLDAEREVKRCQDIISNLLTFSRLKAEGEEEFSFIKPSELLERILLLHAYKLRSHNINIIRKFPTEEPPIRIKVHKMQQVILNLITNAIDSMQHAATKDLTLFIEFKKTEVIIAVSDSGTGIDEETLDRIFDPFFTTKQTGQGTGLGLSVSQSIVEEHGGKLTCESILGAGAKFTVTLPFQDER